MEKKKKFRYCETLKVGFYLQETNVGNRAYYFTGTTKGNKWIDLEVPDAEWFGLLWTCITKDIEYGKLTYYGDVNPTEFNLF